MITMASSSFFLLFALVAVTFGRVAADCDEACQRDCPMKLHECQAGSHAQGGGQGGMGYAAAEDDDDDDELDDDEQDDDSSQDPCSSSPPDPCSQAKGVSECLDKLSDCEDVPGFKQTADGLRAMETQYCSTEIRCAALSTKCPCLLQSAGVEKICTAYEDVDKCLDSLPEECFNVGSGSLLQLMRNTMDAFNEIVCDREAGGCPEAAECMSMLSRESPSSSPKAEGSGNNFRPPAMPTLEANKVCTTLSVYDCLTKASDTCSIDQGSVTMTQIKIETNELCTGTLSKSLPVLEKCGAFTQCLTTFKYFPDFLKSAPMTGLPDAKMLRAIITLFAQTSRSGFWCLWIRQHYECAILNQDSCELPEDAVTTATRKNETLSTMCMGAATYVAEQYTGDAVTVQKSASLFALIAATWFFRLY